MISKEVFLIWNMSDFKKNVEIQVPLIDLTALNQTDSVMSNQAVIDMANEGISGIYPAAVCLYPKYANLLVNSLKPEIRSCVVSAYFPSSQAPFVLKQREMEYLNDTAIDEIDIVMPLGEFLEGNYKEVSAELSRLRQATNKTLKVILETGAMSSGNQVKDAAQIAIESGADFIKTSTGKYHTGATIEAVSVMAKTILENYGATGKKTGLKVAGGIRTVEEANTYIDTVSGVLGGEWIKSNYFRIGASGLYHQIKTTVNA